ncbi:cadherin EGF LAG seven-pass G-type receptor 3-like isoform X4 [Chiloscyllium punctatum]|uniref:cadherin EGF LAG seven-pass G-type receptor 3-like isoform X4 n=1 Tax=Chiloscyllium punctatum TaxID=137246 RepID=UPI003B63A6FA
MAALPVRRLSLILLGSLFALRAENPAQEEPGPPLLLESRRPPPLPPVLLLLLPPPPPPGRWQNRAEGRAPCPEPASGPGSWAAAPGRAPRYPAGCPRHTGRDGSGKTERKRNSPDAAQWHRGKDGTGRCVSEACRNREHRGFRTTPARKLVRHRGGFYRTHSVLLSCAESLPSERKQGGREASLLVYRPLFIHSPCPGRDNSSRKPFWSQRSSKSNARPATNGRLPWDLPRDCAEVAFNTRDFKRGRGYLKDQGRNVGREACLKHCPDPLLSSVMYRLFECFLLNPEETLYNRCAQQANSVNHTLIRHLHQHRSRYINPCLSRCMKYASLENRTDWPVSNLSENRVKCTRGYFWRLISPRNCNVCPKSCLVVFANMCSTWGSHCLNDDVSAPSVAWTAPGTVREPSSVQRLCNPDNRTKSLGAPATNLSRPLSCEVFHSLQFFKATKGCLKSLLFGLRPRNHSKSDLLILFQLNSSKAMQFETFNPQFGRRGKRAVFPVPLTRTSRSVNRRPHFPQYNYQVQVAENQPPGTRVISITAVDPDSGEAGRLYYSMASLMDSRSMDYFTIDAERGLLSTSKVLDRESMDLHYFRITAVDHGIPRLSATTMISITVRDTNDHNPVFEQTEYRETIRENVEEGYPILQLRATDIDSPSNANIRYRFMNQQAAHAVFEIDARSGLITTRGSVDRETMEKYSLIVEANDQGKDPGPKSATVKVYITVLDENDNIPQFSEKRYIVQVREDIRPHTQILQVTATDLDKDNNALVHYNIISGNSRGQFSIDSLTGAIEVVTPLDFEVEREYALRVRAQDAGRPPLSNNTGMVSIQLVDVNDNAPIFVSTPFQVSVLENAPLGHSVIHIQAVDADYGENARLEYRLTDTATDTPFVINSGTGWITVSAQLDRESVEHYSFGVEAWDHGSPSLSASASVTITVMDVNDNRPEFTQTVYFIRLNEDAAVGTSVLTVTAVDRDVNGVVTYQITGGNTRNRFSISTQGGMGIITLALPLDYKQERRYVLTITASDRTLHDTCHVHVNITDANTHRPVFQSAHYSVNVNEDRPVGSTVVVISATDDDVGENARITYYLEDNIPQFRIDPDSGAITLQTELDYEDQMTYTLAITAKDNGIPQKSDTTYVEIMVKDVNDNSPVFVNVQYQGSVSEDAPPFTSVLQISATDRDAHANGRVQYTFQNGEDGDGDFTIEPTSGIVRTVRRLDRESVPIYDLTAYAVDRGIPVHRTPVHIHVSILDVNDNAPVFPADEFEVFVKENSIVGSVVGKITAADPDEGSNAQIMYQIVEGNIPEIFQMDIFSGELTALTDLDYEVKSEYVIVVQATSAPLVSRATVHIRLIDQNDNSPVLKNFQIIFNNYISNKSNTFPSGVIGKIPAYDPDVSDRLFYTVERGNELSLMNLNQTSGQLRLSRKLDNNRPLVASMLVTVTGDHCEVDSQSGHCSPGVCRNGGTCTNLPAGGFKCNCPSGGYEKPYCEVTARSFPPKSFVMFHGLRQRFHMTISLSFATQENNGLLFYNGRFNEKHDFIAVEIVDGQAQLKYSTGESMTVVTPYLPGGVSDGQWHTIQIQYYNKPKIGSVGIAQGPSEQKVAILTVDDCDTSIAVRFGDDIGNYSCAAEGVQSSSKKSLDLTGPLLLGGVPNLPENFPVINREFVGCMKELHIDSKRVDMAAYIANNGTFPGCNMKQSFCDSNPCKNGGTCMVIWETFLCECPLGFGSKDCGQVMHHPYHFQGNSLLSWDFKNEVKISIPWYLGLMFRTRHTEAVLVQAHAGQYTTIVCQLNSGHLSFAVNRGTSRTIRLLLNRMPLNDGKWHDLQLELRDVRNGRDIRYIATITIDFGLYQDTVVVGNELHGLKLKHLQVGGILRAGEVQNGLDGCIQGVRLGETSIGIAMPKPSRTMNVELGCTIPDPCDSTSCPPNSYCSDEWQSYSCICEPGYYGESCIDACQLNPCENESVCRRKPSSSHGYTCDCGENHFGQYCEHRIDHQCPKGWWGNPTCGPCNCDISKGFDPDCNKTNGQCYCKEFHYRPVGSDACLPCDCYPIGSFSRSCDQETGQCHCRSGVIGRQCNQCDNPFAEVTHSGCEVIYDGCPKSLKAGVWWPRTKFGLPAAVLCPKGSLGVRADGTVIRHCGEEHGWLEPDLFNCTSPPFMQLAETLERLERNETELNTIEAKKLARHMRTVTEEMDQYFGNDIHITYHLLLKMLEFECKQRGFNLTATQDVHYTENVLRTGSAALGLENAEHWNILQQTERGTAHLMEQIEEYMRTLTRNMKLTYLNPVAIVTPNIILTIDHVENSTKTRKRFPRYHSRLFRGQSTWDAQTHIVLPRSVLFPPKVKAIPTSKEENSIQVRNETSKVLHQRMLPETEPTMTILILLIYRTLGSLLPARFNTDRRNLRLPKHPVMNSPIVTISIFNNNSFVHGALNSPLILEFRLLETANRSKPVCVQWNHSSLSEAAGTWTAKDCDLVHRNTTHVRCQCSQLGIFGVLMDISHREQLEGDLETLAIVTYSTISVSLVALLLTFFILTCLNGLKSNTRGIHCNIAAAIFCAELVFLLGINQTENQFLCTVIAILLHYFFMATFAWIFVEGLHIYRMQTEARNINYGAMRFYYAIGWGVPAIITGLAVGLDPEGYGNPDFCWISVHDKLIWSFAGPIAVVIVMNIVISLLVARMSCAPTQKEAKKRSILTTIRSAFILLLIVSATWLFGLMAVNNSILAFHYLYTVLCCFQGLAVLVLFCILSEEVQEAWKFACLGKRSQGDDTTRAPQLSGSHPYNNTSLFEESGLHRITLGTSTISSVSTARSARTHSSQPGYLRENLLVRQGSALDQTLLGHTGPTDIDVAMFHRPQDAGGGGDNDSDTDSDLSLDEERSLSLASSESEENERYRGRFPRRFKRTANSERLLTDPLHTTPKDCDGNDLISYWPALGECEVHACSLQKWGSERKLGLDFNKDATNNNQPDTSIASGDESTPTHLLKQERQRKGILKNRMQYPSATLKNESSNSINRMQIELPWYNTSTLGPRVVPAASYGRMYSGAGSLSQPASRYSSREQLDMLVRRHMSKEQLDALSSRHASRDRLATVPSRHGSREQLDITPSGHASREHQERVPSRHGSREQLDSIPRRHGSREHLDMLPVRQMSKEWLNTVPNRQMSREQMDTVPSRHASREHLEALSNKQPSREHLDTLSRRQPSREQLGLTSSRHSSREQLDTMSRRYLSRERLDPMPSRHPSREQLNTLPRRQPSREQLGPLPSRQPSTEQLDILSSILASFNSSALSSAPSTTTPSAPQTTFTPSGAQTSSMTSAPCPSTPHSATSHSISEISPDSEMARADTQS